MKSYVTGKEDAVVGNFSKNIQSSQKSELKLIKYEQKSTCLWPLFDSAKDKIGEKKRCIDFA